LITGPSFFCEKVWLSLCELLHIIWIIVLILLMGISIVVEYSNDMLHYYNASGDIC